MGVKIFSLILLLPIVPLVAEEIVFEKRKREILALEKQLGSASLKEVSAIHFALAQGYLEDQEVEKAFRYFLEALEKAPIQADRPLEAGEKALYEEALSIYFKEGGVDPERSGRLLLEKFEAVAHDHPEYLHLNLIVAMAQANCGNFLPFFESFYRIYPNISQHFISYKARAILCLRLMHFAKLGEEREHFRAQGIHFIEKAMEKNGSDSGLYKMRLILAHERKDREKVALLLTQFIDREVEVPRSDILFYVNEALWVEKRDLAEKIVAKAAALYDYSRAVQAAQDFLKSL